MLPPCGPGEAQGCCRSWQDMSSPNSLFERAKRPRATLMNLDSGTRLTVSIAGLGHIRFGPTETSPWWAATSLVEKPQLIGQATFSITHRRREPNLNQVLGGP